MVTITDIGEFELIRKITRPVKDKNVVVGIGDDCAVLEYSATHYQLLTTDTLVDGDHFRTDWFTAFQVGRKAVVANVSDIFSMGGVPKYMLISLCLHNATPLAWVEELYRGVYSLCDRYKIAVVGGNMTHGDKIIVTISLVGYVEKKLLRLRSMAKIGDIICVTGALGGSAAGLTVLKAGLGKSGDVTQYLEPNTILQSMLKKIVPYVHAMIDVSDGLASEVHHICEASKVGSLVYKEKIPLALSTKKNAQLVNKDPYYFALHGGEDYQMVVTLAPEYLKRISGCTVVGKIVDKKQGIWLVDRGVKKEFGKGYDHFRK